MGSGIYVAVAGARSQSDALEVIANNVSSAGTVGYRAERVSFGEALATAQSPDTRFVSVNGTKMDTSQGAFRDTGNPLDLALVGDGYFGVQTPRGARYTRAGDFRLDDEGRIVNSSGFAALDSNGGSIGVPAGTSEVRVDGTGAVFADGQELGRLMLAQFAQGSMSREGSNLFVAKQKPLQGADGAQPKVVSGSLEQSNINVVRGVVDMVRVSRTYQALMRMIEGYKQIDSRTARSLGGQ